MKNPPATGVPPPEELAKALMRREATPSELPRKPLAQREQAFGQLQWPEGQTFPFQQYRGDSDSWRAICTRSIT